MIANRAKTLSWLLAGAIACLPRLGWTAEQTSRNWTSADGRSLEGKFEGAPHTIGGLVYGDEKVRKRLFEQKRGAE